MTSCEVCGIDGTETGAYGDRYLIPVRTVTVESDAYDGDTYSYAVCDTCESLVR